MSNACVRNYSLAALLVVIVGMPFHAFISVWLGSLTGQMPQVQAWKEVIITVVAAATVYLAWREPEVRLRLLQPLALLIYAFISVALIISLASRPPLTAFAYGLKTDIEFLVAFVSAYALAGPKAVKLATAIVVSGLAVVAFIGTMQIYLLPKDFLAHFGYSAATILPYQNLTTQVSAFRILSTLGGPNQLGSYLILPLALVVTLMFRRWHWWQPVIGVAAVISLWHTYSRSAWLGAIIALAVTLAIELPHKWRRVVLATSLTSLVVVIAGLSFGVSYRNSLQAYVLHGQLSQYGMVGSDAERLASQEDGIKVVVKHPAGQGLGTSGPASKHGGNYTITENYYLQLAAEVGIIGLGMFVAIEILLGWTLWRLRLSLLPAGALLGSLVGISLINFLLHGWADSSTALIYWTYAGIALGSQEIARV